MTSYNTFGGTALPEALETRVNAELAAREQLLWVGQPRPGRFMLYSIPLVLFGIPWTAFAVFWIVMASGIMFGGAQAAPGGFGAVFACFPLFGLPFVLIGLGMLTSPFWMWHKARRTCYALTDLRAVIWEPGWFGSVAVRSYGPADLIRLQRNQNADGSGDLIFEEYFTYGRQGGRTTNYRGFMGIERAREVEELLRKALLAGTANPPPGRP